MIPMPAGFIHMLFTAESPESAVLLRQATGRIVWIGRRSLRPMLVVMTGSASSGRRFVKVPEQQFPTQPQQVKVSAIRLKKNRKKT